MCGSTQLQLHSPAAPTASLTTRYVVLPPADKYLRGSTLLYDQRATAKQQELARFQLVSDAKAQADFSFRTLGLMFDAFNTALEATQFLIGPKM